MPPPPQLDHVVINTRYDMDAAAASFAELGFHLTARGYHTLGSINHLMMFGTDYLELIGLPADADRANPGRPDVANAPLGINGLVFKTADVDDTYAHLQAIGMAGAPPKSFSRPVTLADGTKQDVRFRTVAVRDGVFPGGRVYFCQHLTPELVWRPEWQQHANGAAAMPQFVVAADDPAAQAARYAALLGSSLEGGGDVVTVPANGCRITILSPTACRDRYGALASVMNGRSEIFAAVVISTRNLGAVRTIAANVGLPSINEPDRVVIRQPHYDAVLEFRG